VCHHRAQNWDLWVTTELWIETCRSLQSSELRLVGHYRVKNSDVWVTIEIQSPIVTQQVSILRSIVTNKSQFWALSWPTNLNSELHSDPQVWFPTSMVTHYRAQNWDLFSHYRAQNLDLWVTIEVGNQTCGSLWSSELRFVGHDRAQNWDLLVTIDILSSIVTHKSDFRPLWWAKSLNSELYSDAQVSIQSSVAIYKSRFRAL
jgi:hypothetical protein